MRELFHSPTGFSRFSSFAATFVQRAGAMCRELVVLAQRIVEHLVLEAERGVIRRVLQREFLGHVVLHAAVRAGRHLPLERELEVAERVDGHQIAAVRRLTVGHLRDVAARDFLDRPSTIFQCAVGTLS